MTAVEERSVEAPATFSFAKLIGPGLLVAAAGIGAGDIVSATMSGANWGLALLWVVALAAFLKCFLNYGIARWQLATNTTAIEGWCQQLPRWVGLLFGGYLVIWTISVSAALTSACGLGMATLTGGAIPRPYGAVAHALIGGLFVLVGGFSGFEKVMKLLIATMFFSMVACAVLTFGDPATALQGFVPRIPPGAGSSFLSVLGGIGGSIAMLAYNYWLREEKMVGPKWLNYVRADIIIAYVFTALFGMSVMIVANRSFHLANVTITNSQAVTKMAETLAQIVGPVGFWAYAIGFWAAVFASLLGVWQSIPYLFADYYGLQRKYDRVRRSEITQVRSTPYRLALAFISLAPIPFAFLDQPLFLIKAFTIIGSMFIPFLAATLLYLNNFRIPAESGVPKNSWLTNTVLVFALVLFVVVGASEAGLLRK